MGILVVEVSMTKTLLSEQETEMDHKERLAKIKRNLLSEGVKLTKKDRRPRVVWTPLERKLVIEAVKRIARKCRRASLRKVYEMAMADLKFPEHRVRFWSSVSRENSDTRSNSPHHGWLIRAVNEARSETTVTAPTAAVIRVIKPEGFVSIRVAADKLSEMLKDVPTETLVQLLERREKKGDNDAGRSKS